MPTSNSISESNLTLYELESNLVEAFRQIQEAHAAGLDAPQEVVDLIGSYVDSAVAKRDRCAKFLMHLENTEAAIKAEIDRLSRKRDLIESAKERFEGYILAVMDRIGLTKLQGEAFTFSARKNPPSVLIDSLEQIPEQFLRPAKPAPPREADKNLIKKEIQAERKVPGARLLTGKTRLVVE